MILVAAALPARAAGADAQRMAAAANIDWTKAEAITVRLSDFEFRPDHLALRAGVPVRLFLINTGSGKHTFTAPEFFATAVYKDDAKGPPEGEIVVKKRETAELAFVPMTPGEYKLECGEFLHSFFGMTGKIDVAPPSQ